jgi:hypothetical protein
LCRLPLKSQFCLLSHASSLWASTIIPSDSSFFQCFQRTVVLQHAFLSSIRG